MNAKLEWIGSPLGAPLRWLGEGPCSLPNNIRIAQEKMGIRVDGTWGPGTQCAYDRYAGDLAADIACTGAFPAYIFKGTQAEQQACATGGYPCPPGQKLDLSTGTCKATAPPGPPPCPATCPAGQKCDSATGQCVVPTCPAGQHPHPVTGDCVADTTGGTTKAGMGGVLLLALAALAAIGVAVASTGKETVEARKRAA